MHGSRLRAVEVEDIPGLVAEPAPQPKQPEDRSQAAFTNLLMMSLRALSQRAVVALASLVDLALIGSAFALWMMVISEPTVLQLVGAGMYGAFVLVSLLLRRRNA